MAWSGMLPDTLPAWMYHAQLPPPKHVFNDQIFGLTWVDLVFPFFLFSMGAAIPLALSRRQSQGQSKISISATLLFRGLLLALFAIYGEHLRANEWSQTPDTQTWETTIAGWVLLVLMFIRWPKRVPVNLGRAITAAAWIGATLLIAYHLYPDHQQGFENSRNDVILMVLANVAVSGGILWLLTRNHPLWRILAAAAVGLVFLTATTPNSLGKLIWDFTPLQYLHWETWANSRFVPVFYHFEYHKYLIVVLSGTFCGDLVLATATTEAAAKAWHWTRYFAILILSFAAPVIACIGLLARETIPTGAALAGIGVLLMAFCLKPKNPIELLIARLARYGFGLILMGVLAEPIGGGIRKDEPTLSYFLLTAGLAFWLIAGFEVLFDVAKTGKWLRLLTWTGMNPILAYITITNLVIALDGFTGYSNWLATTPLATSDWQMALLSGGVKTLVVALVASLFTRAKLFLRT